jgi:thiol-disulfide isomerase/thioredoxin
MFRAMFTPIIRSTLLYLQYLVVFIQVAASWCPKCVETELCTRLTIYIVQLQLIRDTSRQQLG